MDNLHEHFSWKIWVIILFALAGILVLLLIFSIFFSSSKERNIPKVSESPQPTTSISQKNNPSPSITLYKTDLFQIEVPSGWEVAENATPVGKSYIVKYTQSVATYPRILIEVSKSGVTLSSRRNDLLRAGFIENKAQLNNQSASKFLKIEQLPLNGKTLTSIQLRYYLFTARSSVFLVGYEYEGEKLNKEAERFFEDALKTFKTN